MMNEIHNLSDVSFLIPVRIDSEERKANLISAIEFLSSNFVTHIFVIEAGTRQSFLPSDINTNVTYHFILDTDPVFYKACYVNMLLELSETLLAVVWDADIIAYPELIVNGVYRLRNGESFLVYPYDGRVHFVDPLMSKIFRQTMRLDVLKEYVHLMDLTYGYYATGGAYMVNREKYLEVGGENENFYGWGPEDTERVKRMEVLGLDVHYEQGGGLFHLWHPRKSNSWFANEKIELRNRKELLHTCSTDSETLLKHLKR